MLGRFIGSNFLGGAKAKYMWLVSALSIGLIFLSYPIAKLIPEGYQPGVPNLMWLEWLLVEGRPLFVLVAVATASIALIATLNRGKATANTGLLLGICAMATSVLVAISMLSTGPVAMWSIILVGFFNSIMFPSIFYFRRGGVRAPHWRRFGNHDYGDRRRSNCAARSGLDRRQNWYSPRFLLAGHLLSLHFVLCVERIEAE